jgi:N-acetylmuramoyl-L-alanine amidase
MPEPSRRPIAGRTVILDAGHGGDDFGASHHGLREKDICLDLALRTAAILRAKGVTVHLTRQTDVFIPLPDRSAFANRHPGAILVSIHVNASDRNAAAAGIETYVLDQGIKDAEREKTAAGRYQVRGSDSLPSSATLASLTTKSRKDGPALAGAIQKQLVGRLAVPDRGVRSKNLAVLRETYFCPAVLVEVGFLTHVRTAAEMKTDAWRRRTAEGLAEGVADFLRQPAGS